MHVSKTSKFLEDWGRGLWTPQDKNIQYNEYIVHRSEREEMETFANIGNIIAAFDQHQAFQAKLELFRGWDEAARFIQDNLAISGEDKSEARSAECRLRGNELFKKGAFRAALGSKRQFFKINFRRIKTCTSLFL